MLTFCDGQISILHFDMIKAVYVQVDGKWSLQLDYDTIEAAISVKANCFFKVSHLVLFSSKWEYQYISKYIISHQNITYPFLLYRFVLKSGAMRPFLIRDFTGQA